MSTGPPPKPPPKPKPHRPPRKRKEPLTPANLRERIFDYATSNHPPAGAGFLALAGWTLWMTTIASPRWRNHLIGAAGFFIVCAVITNRIYYRLRVRKEEKEREERLREEREKKGDA